MSQKPSLVQSAQSVPGALTPDSFVRGLLERPVSLTVPFGNIQAEPQMTTEQHSALRKANKERLSANPEPEASAPEPEVHSQPKPSSAPVAPTDDPDAGEHTEAAPIWGD